MHYLVDLTLRILTIYGGISAGFLLQKWSKAEKLGKWLLFVGLYILTPLLLIFVNLSIEDFSDVNWGFIFLITTISMLISMILEWLIVRKKTDMTNPQKGAELSATGFMNAFFYPFPLIIGLFPESSLQAEALLAASLFLLFQTLYRNSLGVFLGIHFGSNTGKSIWQIIKDLLLFPPTIGMIVGLILRFSIGYIDTTPYIALDKGLDIFRDITMFIMLAIVGLSFKFPKKEEWKEITIFRGVFTRFGGGLLSVLVVFFLPISITIKIPLIVQSMAPPAVANSAYAKYFNLDQILTSRYIALLTLVALIFLPIELALLLFWKNTII